MTGSVHLVAAWRVDRGMEGLPLHGLGILGADKARAISRLLS